MIRWIECGSFQKRRAGKWDSNWTEFQRGLIPADFKHVPAIGKGVEELRVRDASGAYRVIYPARRKDGVYVLHAFKKKTRRIPKADIELARGRLAELVRR